MPLVPETPTPAAVDPPPSARDIRAAFDRAPSYTLGIEEEVMLLDPETLGLLPRAPEVLARLEGDPRFKLELPASQLEIVLAPLSSPDEVAVALTAARRTLLDACAGLGHPAAAGAHPFSPGIGRLNRTPRYAEIVGEYGTIAARQLVCALQVHVAVGDSDRALAVYNALRSYLPLLAALAANAPFYEGCDSGLASVRPKLCELLPRQGVPPAIESWEVFAEMLRWGARARTFPQARAWWWELRPHPSFGTLELRVPDAQSTVADAVAVAAVAQALVVWLGGRHDHGERLPCSPRWQIEENRWSACRHGVEGTMAELASGEPRSTRGHLHALLDVLRETAVRLGTERRLEHARRMVELNGALAQRRAAGEEGPRGAARWLAERFSRPEMGSHGL
jgi:glutamate---cysteine ligase / carboxylate-amine ligase